MQIEVREIRGSDPIFSGVKFLSNSTSTIGKDT